jgi:hypothetical protein
VHGHAQSLREKPVEPVKRGIGQYDISDGAVSFKSDRRHFKCSSLSFRQWP